MALIVAPVKGDGMDEQAVGTVTGQAVGTVTGQPEAVRGEHGADEALVDEELLVEEVSIDGMCGVY